MVARPITKTALNVSKMIAYRLLEPAMRLPQQVQIVCRDGAADRLLTELATHNLDLVIADTPISPAIKVKAAAGQLPGSKRPRPNRHAAKDHFPTANACINWAIDQPAMNTAKPSPHCGPLKLVWNMP